MDPSERENVVKRSIVIAGKASPGFTNEKNVIKLINNIADVINADSDINNFLKVAFIPNYNVSVAQILITGSDVSQHLSTPGMEASGTSNMKFVMNGALLVGSYDGANIEIAEHVGYENVVLFGSKFIEHGRSKEVQTISAPLADVLDFMRLGMFGSYEQMSSVLESLENENISGKYLISHDFMQYCSAQELIEGMYKNRSTWIQKTITAAIRIGYFSSDRTVSEYVEKVWGIQPIEVQKMNEQT